LYCIVLLKEFPLMYEYLGDNCQWEKAQCIPNVQPYDTSGTSEIDWFCSDLKSSCQGLYYLLLYLI